MATPGTQRPPFPPFPRETAIENWNGELDYRLIKELWAFDGSRSRCAPHHHDTRILTIPATMPAMQRPTLSEKGLDSAKTYLHKLQST